MAFNMFNGREEQEKLGRASFNRESFCSWHQPQNLDGTQKISTWSFKCGKAYHRVKTAPHLPAARTLSTPWTNMGEFIIPLYLDKVGEFPQVRTPQKNLPDLLGLADKD